MTDTILLLGLLVIGVLFHRDLLRTVSAASTRLAQHWCEFRQAARDFQDDLDRWR